MWGLKPDRVVIYDDRRWDLLASLRKKAVEIMECLARAGQPSLLYGSVARGDVGAGSDVDVVVLRPRLPPSALEMILRERFGDPLAREIAQATPSSAVKAYIHLEKGVTVSFPLVHLGEREEEFYKFGGCLDLRTLLEEKRVPGVNKELMLILPREWGHEEVSVRGREEVVAKLLGISLGTVLERVRVLTERRVRGKTGLYVHYRLDVSENIEEALVRLAHAKKGLRNKLRGMF